LTFFWIAERYRRQLQRSRYAKLVNWVHFVLMMVIIVLQSVKVAKAIQTPIAG
jgi:hypothetical protein